jgi:hypothetical protein
MLVVLATQGAKVGGSRFEVGQGKKHKTLPEKY